ncbi:hypothetical protein FGG08_005135 [Glutinoglossum americanum]|uniref:Pantetheine-phosphate adenylyltransferase family protein n=1 Tax=Glutinoglossum americanum TaxID=1670608 RepID=A0A9P8I0X5_9PEZI|nr:hypothetical protein FGG08_005135 [Glutinoglossum americanum]
MPALKTPPRSLLLLPPPPSLFLYPTLKAAYGAALSSVLSSVSETTSDSLEAAVLEIAVPIPYHYLPGHTQWPRSQIYDQTQKLVAGLYSLISTVCARDSIDIEGKGGVNARILLIAYSSDLTYTNDDGFMPGKSLQGPIVDLPTLALSRRAWQRIFSVHSEEGELLLKQFLDLTDHIYGSGSKRPCWDVKRVDGVADINTPIEKHQGDQLLEPNRKIHYSVAVGGTFDHLHAGHKLLLTMTALLPEPHGLLNQQRRIIVGITQDELLKNKKYAEFLESWEDRQQGVSSFLLALLDYSPPEATSPDICQVSRSGPNERVVHIKLDPTLEIECVAISDPFGPTITDKSISALVVSGETRGGGQAVNAKRGELGWSALEVFEVDVLEADEPGDGGKFGENFDGKISSTELRRRWGEKSAQLHRDRQEQMSRSFVAGPG